MNVISLKVQTTLSKICFITLLLNYLISLSLTISKFHVYLYGREFHLQVDHQPLAYLQKAKFQNARLMRWALYLQQYRFAVQSIAGLDNVGADYLSRCSVDPSGGD